MQEKRNNEIEQTMNVWDRIDRPATDFGYYQRLRRRMESESISGNNSFLIRIVELLEFPKFSLSLMTILVLINVAVLGLFMDNSSHQPIEIDEGDIATIDDVVSDYQLYETDYSY